MEYSSREDKGGVCTTTIRKQNNVKTACNSALKRACKEQGNETNTQVLFCLEAGPSELKTVFPACCGIVFLYVRYEALKCQLLLFQSRFAISRVSS